MEFITEMVGAINGVVWGVPMLILILGAGLFLTVRVEIPDNHENSIWLFPAVERQNSRQ